MEEKILKEKLVNEVSIEVIAKSIIKEAKEIGFQKGDYLKLANLLLDSAIKIDAGSRNGESINSINYDPKLKTKMPLEGENILVREFDKSADTDNLKKWLEDEIGRYFILTRATSRSYKVDRLIEDENHILGLITLKDNTPIGIMAFLDYDKDQKKSELRKLIGEPIYRGKGFGKEATKLWIQYGISNLGLQKIYLNTLQTNVRNIRLNQELGFKVEGIFRNECIIDGKKFDLLRMGLVV
ncbi:MAG: GNAT family protein [Melioribacteraceae bacterium]|nr:GNAT family N-acetyltransferase [Melioribacteraceae bacterium]MDD3556946.1 GNAT family protein [Melioribacteraceae bacterium]